MASTATHPAAAPSPEEQVLDALEATRQRTLSLVAHLDDVALTTAHSPIMSPLVWDLGHIAAYEDLWLAHRNAELDLLRPDLAAVYDAFETPRAVRGDVNALGPKDARAYMEDVRARVAGTIAERGVGDELICEMVIRHECQHTETMRQTMAIAGLLPAGEPPAATKPDCEGSEWVEIEAGPFEMGAAEHGFAYDNERPRHTVELPGFQIARHPVSNAEWARFTGDATPGDPDAPVCHVNWFEADAFAKAHGARLPSEAEWERAAKAERPALEQVGRVWEWTSSTFGGYPGFEAYPYREYSEVFFGEDYRVLRGGSWATDERVKTKTFRNWDLPQRSQIFAGVRLARDTL